MSTFVDNRRLLSTTTLNPLCRLRSTSALKELKSWQDKKTIPRFHLAGRPWELWHCSVWRDALTMHSRQSVDLQQRIPTSQRGIPPTSAASLALQCALNQRTASTNTAVVGSGKWSQNGQRTSTLEAAATALVVACPGGHERGKTVEMLQPGKIIFTLPLSWKQALLQIVCDFSRWLSRKFTGDVCIIK